MRTSRTSGAMSPFVSLNQNWIVLIILVLLFPIVYLWYKKYKDKEKEAEADIKTDTVKREEQIARAEFSNPVLQEQKAQQIEPSARLRNIAKNLALHLGTHNKAQLHVGENFWSFDWLEGLTEDEEAVMAEFSKFHYKDMPIIKKLYSNVYAIGRDLQQDCKKYLSKQQYARIRWAGTKDN